MKKIIFLIIGPAFLCNIFFNLLAVPVSADSPKTFEGGLNNSATEMGYKEIGENNITTSLYSKIGSALNIIISFLGVIFLGLLIYAGYLWMTARGNEQNVTKAKDIIYGAAIGLVIVLSAYALTQLAATLWPK